MFFIDRIAQVICTYEPPSLVRHTLMLRVDVPVFERPAACIALSAGHARKRSHPDIVCLDHEQPRRANEGRVTGGRCEELPHGVGPVRDRKLAPLITSWRERHGMECGDLLRNGCVVLNDAVTM
jgi:hypothetical protein